MIENVIIGGIGLESSLQFNPMEFVDGLDINMDLMLFWHLQNDCISVEMIQYIFLTLRKD